MLVVSIVLICRVTSLAMDTGTTASPSGSCVAGFQLELSSIQTFRQAQSQVTDVQSLQRGQCDSLSKRIGLMEKLGVASATHITSVIQSGPWTVAQKEVLATALQNRLSAGALCSPEAKVKGRRRNQHCTSFERYLTQSDMHIIQDQTVGFSEACSNSSIL